MCPDDGTKLLTDLTGVPRGFADLVKARAYRHRSVELSKVTSQKTGKTHPWVVTGLAWLGGKMPAVRTLDDVVGLYEADGGGVRAVRVVTYENGGSVVARELLDAAVRDGRVALGERSQWARYLEAAPELATGALELLPTSPGQRRLNREASAARALEQMTVTEREAWERRELAARLGCRPEDVI